MVGWNINIKVLDPHVVNDDEKVALNKFDNRMLREQWPDDSPRSIEETIGYWRFVPRYLDLHQWAAWTRGDDEVVARASINIGRYDENQHMADFDIYVVPEMRRRGVATRMLALVAEVAGNEDRQLLITSIDSNMAAGAAFLEHLNARIGVQSTTHQLDLRDLNLQLVDEWCQRGEELSKEFELGTWEGEYPSDDVAAMTSMKEVMNTSPTDDLEFGEFYWTVDQIRQEERELVNQGTERWTVYARHTESGGIAGYSEVSWSPGHAETLTQGSTAVIPRFRGRGLAQWLKGEMLRIIINRLSKVTRIRSEVADSNASMLSINERLGFKPYKSWTTWQVDLDQVFAYLETKRA